MNKPVDQERLWGRSATPLYDNASSGYYGTGAGNMTDMPIPGNETVKESAVYDAWNRMVEIEDHTGAEIAAYAYNGLNYRVQKVDYSQSPNVTTDYIYNENWQALEEQRTVVGHSIFTYIQYVWDPRYIDAPVCRFRDANSPVSGDGTLEETLYYCNDANMNVTALVDASGTVDERYTYDAYGQVHMFNGSWTSIGTTSAYDNQILFGGYRYDPESGLYHVRNRMYHPTLGMWGRRDPLGYAGSFNLYAYAVSDPATETDSTGLGILISSGTYTYQGAKKAEKWIDTLIAAFGKLCPCAKYTYDDIRRGGSKHYTKTYLQASENAEYQGKAFCDCLNDHKAGCSLLHDLIISAKDYIIDYTRAMSGPHAASFDPSTGKDEYGDPLPGTVRWNPAYNGDKGTRSSEAAAYEGINTVDSQVVLAMELSHAWFDQQKQGTSIGFDPKWPDKWPSTEGGSRFAEEALGVVVQNQVFHELVTGSTDNRMNYNATIGGTTQAINFPIIWYKTQQDYGKDTNQQTAKDPYFGSCDCDKYKLPWKNP